MDVGGVEVMESSSVNVSLVRSISAAWERGDYGSTEWADEDIEFVVADGPESGCLKGRESLAPSLAGFQDAWAEYHSRVQECRELDDERVLVLTHTSGRGRASGLETAQERANLFHVRAGKVVRVVAYWSRERALAEAGSPLSRCTGAQSDRAPARP